MVKDIFKTIVSVISANAFFILLLGLFVVLTLNLFHQRDILATEQHEQETNEGEGVEVLIPVKIEEWSPYYGGGFGIDNVITLDGEALRISSGGDGGWYGAKASIAPIDFSNKTLRFAFRYENLADVGSLRLLLASDNGEFQDYFSFNVKGFFAEPTAGEWYEVVVNKSDFEVAEGLPDWSRITDIGVRLIGESGIATRVWVDGFAVVPTVGEPIVSITFDDGFASVMDANRVMNAYDMRGTLFAIPWYVDTEGFLSQGDIDVLHAAGWDISGHSNVNLRTIERYGDLDTELALVRAYLDSYEYKGREHFAYPNGSYNKRVRSLVAEYFTSGRTIDGFSQPQSYIIPTKVNAKTISVETDKEDIKRWIDEAITERSWLILTWHDIVDNATADTEYNVQDFIEITEYVHNTGVSVLPYSEAYQKLTSEANRT